MRPEEIAAYQQMFMQSFQGGLRGYLEARRQKIMRSQLLQQQKQWEAAMRLREEGLRLSKEQFRASQRQWEAGYGLRKETLQQSEKQWEAGYKLKQQALELEREKLNIAAMQAQNPLKQFGLKTGDVPKLFLLGKLFRQFKSKNPKGSFVDFINQPIGYAQLKSTLGNQGSALIAALTKGNDQLAEAFNQKVPVPLYRLFGSQSQTLNLFNAGVKVGVLGEGPDVSLVGPGFTGGGNVGDQGKGTQTTVKPKKVVYTTLHITPEKTAELRKRALAGKKRLQKAMTARKKKRLDAKIRRQTEIKKGVKERKKQKNRQIPYWRTMVGR